MENNDVKKEVINIKVTESDLARKGFEIEEDKLKRKKVKLYIFKGVSYGEAEKFDNYTLKMIRLKIKFTDDLSKYLPVNMAVKELLETLDVDIELFEMFLHKFYSKPTVSHIVGPIKELYKVKPIGSLLKVMELEYHQFEYLVKFLKYLCYEGLTKEELL